MPHELPDSPEQPRLRGADQTIADSEQTLSDTDQTGSDSDQTSADSDQLAADRDQAASDRDLAAGTDQDEHHATRELRQRTTRQRQQGAQARLDAAEKRDATAQARDVAALARDQVAEAHSLSMAQRDAAYHQEEGVRVLNGEASAKHAAAQRKRAAEDRAQAAAQRTLAAHDRHDAAKDRESSAHERLRALVDREALVRQLVVPARQIGVPETDPLTGVRTRAAGVTELDQELDRCRRTGGRLVAIYLDVVGLQALNDGNGQSAGDQLLKRLTRIIKGHMRSYDLIVRMGDDEFLLAMSNMTLEGARERMNTIAAVLADGTVSGAIGTGFAKLAADETAAELVARADRDRLEHRSAQLDSPPAV